MLNLETLKHLWPHGDSNIHGLMDGMVISAPVVLPKYGIANDLALAHLMAQISHECGAGTEVVENMSYSEQRMMQVWPTRFPDFASTGGFAHNPRMLANKVYGSRMGNHPGTDDGYNFRGRGACQTTGRDGYQKLATKTGLDLINHPELVNDPAHFLECGVADFVICGCLPFALKDDVLNVTKRLNGGIIGLAERKAWLSRWKQALARPQTQPVS